MLWNASTLTGYAISTTDGEIGSVKDLLFDDENWMIRWLVVDAGTWLSGRKVLLPPSICAAPNVAKRTLQVDITRQKVKDSPSLDADAPVSRVQETDLSAYYGWQPYWLGYPPAAGMPAAPLPPRPAEGPAVNANALPIKNQGDPHLRSADEVTGYYIRASDGDIGHVEELLLDVGSTWTVRYLVVDTKNWWPGKETIVSPKSFREVDWIDGTVTTDLTRDRIKNAPEYDPATVVDRAYEDRYHGYYNYPPYWM
ncbi:MAG: PRC-barrel domain-containing protein [Pseudorhizobium sp.]